MLRSLVQIKASRFFRNSALRSISSNDTVLNQDGCQSSKQSFANEKLKEKINNEFKRTQERVLTVPNILTLSRMATSPFIGYFIWTGAHHHALACFAFAAVTDLFDGYIARKFNQSSELGAILDPLADKLLLATSVIAMYNTSLLPLWLVKIWIFKDLVVLTGGTIVRYHGFDERPSLKKFFDFKNYPTLGFEPSMISKCNTALQCTLIISHLSTTSMVGIPLYDNSLFWFQALTCLTTTLTFSQYLARWAVPIPLTKAPRLKDSNARI